MIVKFYFPSQRDPVDFHPPDEKRSGRELQHEPQEDIGRVLVHWTCGQGSVYHSIGDHDVPMQWIEFKVRRISSG